MSAAAAARYRDGQGVLAGVQATMTNANSASPNGTNVKCYEDLLHEELRDRELAAAYLTAALAEGSTEELLLALRSVADANDDFGQLLFIAGVLYAQRTWQIGLDAAT
jgi:hypothetical protein